MKEEWAQFLETLPQEKVFLHKDELIGEYFELNKYKLPAVLLYKNKEFKLLISAEQMNKIHSIKELKEGLGKILVD
jgi:hypothetical protein